MKGLVGEKAAVSDSVGSRAELSGVGTAGSLSDSESISRELKGPTLLQGDTTELLRRRSALTALLSKVPSSGSDSGSSEDRVGLSYVSNSESALRSRTELANGQNVDRVRSDSFTELTALRPEDRGSVTSNALEYLRSRADFFGERPRGSEGAIPPGEVIFKSARTLAEPTVSVQNRKASDTAYEALAPKTKSEVVLPSAVPLEAIKDAPTQRSLFAALSTDSPVFSGEARLTSATVGSVGSEVSRSVLGQSTVNYESLGELRERFTARLSSDLAQKLTAGFKGGAHKLEFDLLPEKLGRIGVRMDYNEGKLEATISSTSNVTREALAENLPRLRELLVNSGVNVASLDVDSGSQKPSQQNNSSDNREYTGRESSTPELSDDAQRLQVLDFSDLNIDFWV